MAMLSARFETAEAARRVVAVLVDELGATPDLVLTSDESARPGPATDAGTAASHPTAMPSTPSVRVAIHDNAISNEAARHAFEAAGATDIEPIQ